MPETNNTYYIVKEHPLRIINKCKVHSKGTLMRFLLGLCFLYAFLNWIPECLSLYFTTTNIDMIVRLMDVNPADFRGLPGTPVVSTLFSIFFSGVIQLSAALNTLTYVRNRKVEYRALTEGSGFYVKTLCLYLIQMGIVAFWSMLFVIPGIIAAINYSQSYFILADDPSKPVFQVLTESKMMMSGNRLNYARLILYYLPYLMLSYVPLLIVTQAAYTMELAMPITFVLSLIAEIVIFAANGYMLLGRSVFYELLINKGFAYFRYAGQEAFRELENQQSGMRN